ncbi:MAG: hypothetical protein K2Q26_09490 [Bdellovibrionales bacterium]|nr:hypothetical protein [Bdellovibrionales bacterium]
MKYIFIIATSFIISVHASAQCSGSDDYSDCVIDSSDSEFQATPAVSHGDDGAQLQQVSSDVGCLQSPTDKIYRHPMASINAHVKHLNNDFGPADNGRRWHIISCD